MKYYKFIDIDNLEIIQQKTLIFIRDEKLDTLSGFKKIKNWFAYTNACPEILTAFNRYSLKPVNGWVCVTNTLSDLTSEIHIDYISSKRNLCRINLPILNTAGSKTEFYKGYAIIGYNDDVNLIKQRNIDNSKNPDYRRTVKVDEVEIIKPCIIRVQEPHCVKTNLETTPRITITLDMDKDPVSLLEDDNVYG